MASVRRKLGTPVTGTMVRPSNPKSVSFRRANNNDSAASRPMVCCIVAGRSGSGRGPVHGDVQSAEALS